MSKTIRNNQICLLYQEGVTQEDLAIRFNLTKAGVGQILAKAGIRKTDRPSEARRAVDITVNTTRAVKEALRDLCEREGVRMSKFVNDLIVADLESRGVEIDEEVDNDAMLPFEENA